MENKELLNEEVYQKNNKNVKKIGLILIIVGLILSISGFILLIISFLSFANQNSFDNVTLSFSGFTIGGFMMVPGLFITSIGFIVRFLIGNRREITAYTIQQTMPIAKEGIEKITPTVASSLGQISKEIAHGINEGINKKD